jgi:hypothetical protein
MSKTIVTAYIETEVDVCLDDIDVDVMINYIEKKGFVIQPEEDELNFISQIKQLYSTWRTCDGKIFEKELCEFFSEYLEKDIHP